VGLLEDIIKALDRIPGWKRLQELPTQVDDLNGRAMFANFAGCEHFDWNVSICMDNAKYGNAVIVERRAKSAMIS
jgi:hypothetical protein